MIAVVVVAVVIVVAGVVVAVADANAALPPHFKAFAADGSVTWLDDQRQTSAPGSFRPEFREIRTVFGIRYPERLHRFGFVTDLL